MQNFEPEFFFHQKITIVNTFKKPEFEKEKPLTKPDARFFPEGGNLVYGLKSRVAMKLADVTGTITDYSGVLIGAEGDTLNVLHPSAYGVVKFDYLPLKGTDARVILSVRNKTFEYTLPAAVESGFVMRITDSTATQFALNVQSVQVTSPQVFVVIHARNMVSMASALYLNQGKFNLMINKKNLAEGISHVTVFNEEMKPVCERLVFLPMTKTLGISLTPSQNEFGLRRKVGLDIQSMDGGGQSVSSNLSVSVYKYDSIQQPSTGNILNYLWLNSDLPEAPELPTTFLENLNDEKMTILDDIMLTNGWRRFKWNSIASGQLPVIAHVPEMKGHIIRGRMTRYGEPVQGVVTYMASPGTNIQVYGSTSNVNGDVQFETKDFSGARKIYVQPNLMKDSVSRVEILSAFSDKFATYKYTPFRLDEKIKDQLTARSLSMQVQDIFYQDKGALSRSQVIDTTAFYGKADATYYLDDYTRFPVMEEVMREYVPGVLVRKRRDGFHFINLDLINKTAFDEDPFVTLDGIPIFDVDEIMTFDPLKVKKLEVVTRRYYMGVMSLPGIVSYTTYTGDLAGFQVNPKCVVVDYEGLQYQREFYAPKYDAPKSREARMPDQRNLLYWGPAITTGSNGKQHIEFFTSDVTGNFQIVVEGITSDGLSGSSSRVFSVRPFDN